MSTASVKTIQIMSQIVNELPVGTNLALLHLMWAMVNGAFLESRGAIHGALTAAGFDDEEVSRGWQALRSGVWSIEEMIKRWREIVLNEGQGQVRSFEGYKPIGVDTTNFRRPRLKKGGGKFYHHLMQRAVTGIGVGVVTEVGQVAGHRIPLLRQIIAPPSGAENDKGLKQYALQRVARTLAADEVIIHDAGAKISDMHECQVPRFVIRMAANCTACRNVLPEPKKRGRRPEYGAIIRPLARTWKERTIAATLPDNRQHVRFEGRRIKVLSWQDVVCSDQKVNPDNKTFDLFVFIDPLYENPMILATNIKASPHTILSLYIDRWPVEQPPQTTKQTLGLQRQFVSHPVSCKRLPHLGLLVGNILTYLATVLPPIPTGFWDRHPKKRPVVYDASWPRAISQSLFWKTHDFGKSSPSQAICPKVGWLAAQKIADSGIRHARNPSLAFIC